MLGADTTQETVRATHRTFRGVLSDYTFELTFTFQQESGLWVGICTELGTSAFADTFEQMRSELREAVLLQLNEIERIADVREYLADNQVSIVPTKPSVLSKFVNSKLSSYPEFVIT